MNLDAIAPAAFDWWQQVQAHYRRFVERDLWSAISSSILQAPLFYGTVAVAVCSFTLLVWLRVRRHRAMTATPAPAPAAAPAAASDDLAEIYRQYERSDSISRRARRTGAAGADAAGRDGQASGAAVGWLEGIGGEGRIELTADSITIGRHSSNLIVLEDATVHRYHAKLQLNGSGRYDLEDLGGVNGTVVNGTRCQRKELVDGDVIEFGSVKLRYRSQRRTAG